MMDRIGVGEFVRTKKGEICKVLGIDEELRIRGRIASHLSYFLDTRKGSLTPAFILKHSKNIIDLIEEGDYVNGERVKRTYKSEHQQYIVLESRNVFETEQKDIKTIVTKEQIETMEYKVGD